MRTRTADPPIRAPRPYRHAATAQRDPVPLAAVAHAASLDWPHDGHAHRILRSCAPLTTAIRTAGCPQRPPLGFCDGDFDGVSAARDAKRRSLTDAEAEAAAAAAGKDATQRTNMDEMEHMMQEVGPSW